MRIHVRATMLAAATLCAATVSAWDIFVDAGNEIGAIKPMNGVNNGPLPAAAEPSNFGIYSEARIPFARTHDIGGYWDFGGPHVGDITAMFPDFSKDENDPASYDFTLTDAYLSDIIKAGAEPFFRLGQTIEHWPKKYGTNPPPDFAKWARVCEHVILHFNEGWADGHKWNIRYWEIWNEADNMPPQGRKNPCWGGTKEEFFSLFRITLKHLKSRFPHLKIGGPSLAGDWTFAEELVASCEKEKLPLDFFSWHTYFSTLDTPLEWTRRARALLDRHGYAGTESILNEWNYVRDWGPGWGYSMDVQGGSRNCKFAAMAAAAMCMLQNERVDKLMYYDACISSNMNGLFDFRTRLPRPGYWPFYAWSKLSALGTQIKTIVPGEAENPAKRQMQCVAAKGANGGKALLVARYSDAEEGYLPMPVRVKLVAGGSMEGARLHVSDEVRRYSECGLSIDTEGFAAFKLLPNSFALVEMP